MKSDVDRAQKINRIGQDRAQAAANISTSKLREIYKYVKRAETRYKCDGDLDGAVRILQLLKPRLAYTAAREDEDIGDFKDKLTGALEKTIRNPNPEKLDVFFKAVESTVAYHNYYKNSTLQSNIEPKPFDSDDLVEISEDRGKNTAKLFPLVS